MQISCHLKNTWQILQWTAGRGNFMISGWWNALLQRQDAMETETNSPVATTWQPGSHTLAERAVGLAGITGTSMTSSVFQHSGQKFNLSTRKCQNGVLVHCLRGWKVFLFVWSLFDFHHAIPFHYLLELFSKIIGTPEEKHLRNQGENVFKFIFGVSSVNHSHPNIEALWMFDLPLTQPMECMPLICPSFSL